MQDVFRDAFKRAGYRVLVTSDPARAVARFRQDGAAADCVLFSAEQLGESALESFNQLGEDSKTKFVRAILLLDQPQRAWEKNAGVAAHRKVLSMPITMKQLRAVLGELVVTKAAP